MYTVYTQKYVIHVQVTLCLYVNGEQDFVQT